MPGMYEVYSQQRPGRPRWALGASAILLLLTVSLAAALVHHKGGLNDVPLKPFAKAPFVGRYPANWSPIQGELPPEDTRCAWAEPAGDAHQGRCVLLFFRPYRPLLFGGPPDARKLADRYAKQILQLYVAPTGQRAEEMIAYDTPQAIASIGAVTVSVQLTPPDGGRPWICFVRVGVLPGGHAVGAAVLTQDATDIRLLERISQELRIPGLNLNLPPGGGE